MWITLAKRKQLFAEAIFSGVWPSSARLRRESPSETRFCSTNFDGMTHPGMLAMLVFQMLRVIESESSRLQFCNFCYISSPLLFSTHRDTSRLPEAEFPTAPDRPSRILGILSRCCRSLKIPKRRYNCGKAAALFLQLKEPGNCTLSPQRS